MDRRYLYKVISETWESNPRVANSCMAIVNYLISSKIEDQHLTFGALSSISKEDNMDALLKAIYFLAGDKLHILDQMFEARAADGNYINIDGSEIKKFLLHNYYIDPTTGEETTKSDFFSKVTPYFHPTKVIDELRKER